jgi:two-component system, NtrC family, response regulator AlgB
MTSEEVRGGGASPFNGARVLIVDDDASLARSFCSCLEDAGHRCTIATDADQAFALVRQSTFDVCLLDLRLGQTSGLELIPQLRHLAPWLRIVMVTGHGSIDTALKAMRAGASDYLVKPCSLVQLRAMVEAQTVAVNEQRRIDNVLVSDSRNPLLSFDSENAGMKHVLETVNRVADTNATVLILGESGTGKGVVANALHAFSPRAARPFTTVSCPSLSSELLESELFGHKKGAFTGAIENKLGRVEYAEGGTLFLDEVGDIPLALQPKLLRLLQEREYERVGDPISRKADVRIVAATNHDLEELVKQGQFREDLLYRLKVISIRMPPLRDRIEDIAQLADAFLVRFAQQHHRSARNFSADALDAIRRYSWPGNVRELQNVIERAVILATGESIDAMQLGIQGNADALPAAPAVGDIVSLQEIERAHIMRVVARSPSLESAAQTLGIDVSTLYRKRKQYGMPLEIESDANIRDD